MSLFQVSKDLFRQAQGPIVGSRAKASFYARMIITIIVVLVSLYSMQLLSSKVLSIISNFRQFVKSIVSIIKNVVLHRTDSLDLRELSCQSFYDAPQPKRLTELILKTQFFGVKKSEIINLVKFFYLRLVSYKSSYFEFFIYSKPQT